MTLIGFITTSLAVFNSPGQLQIALGLIGLGFIALGLVYVKRALNGGVNKKRFDQIISSS